MGEYLLILYTLSPLTSPGTCLFSGDCGGGSYCADFQVLALGRAPLSLPGEALSGACLPRDTQGATIPVAAARFENLYSAPAITPEQSICRAWSLRCGAADLHPSGQVRPCCPVPSRPLPVPGKAESWAVSRGLVLSGLCCWILGPVLWGICCWILAPSCTASYPQSRRPSPYELLLEPRSPLHTEPRPLP